MLETEAKFRVESHAPVRRHLEERRASYFGRYNEENHILDRPDGSLVAGGCGLRVRSMEALEGQPVPATLTYKGPRHSGPLKRREELEVPIGDAGGCLLILHALGYQTVLSYRKQRDRWAFEGCRIELDDVPGLGLFVEIEGPDEPAIRAVQEALGLSAAEHEPRSYPHMLSQRERAGGGSGPGR